MVSKLRIHQLQVGVFTVVGLSAIDKAVEVLSIPMLYKDYKESDYVRPECNPFSRAPGSQGVQGFELGEAGWVYFFGKTPILTPMT